MSAPPTPAMTGNSGLLLVGPSWVGDMVMAQSLVQVLRRADPDRVIDVLAPAWSAALVERMPGVRRPVLMSIGHGQLGLAQRLALGRRLRGGYDQAIVLPNSLKSALVPFFARIPRRTGYIGECRFGLLNDWRKLDTALLPRTVQRFVALGLPRTASLPPDTPFPELKVTARGTQLALSELGLEPGDQVLVLCPGAEYGPAKRWPAVHFAAVGRAMVERGWRVWVLGSEKDREAGRTVRELIGPACADLTGRTSLAQVVDLISLAGLVVSNDSGLMHVAAALNRPLIAIYGSSDPGFTPPLSPLARIAALGLGCSPCFQRTCPQEHLDCLHKLGPQLVLDKAAELVPK